MEEGCEASMLERAGGGSSNIMLSVLSLPSRPLMSVEQMGVGGSLGRGMFERLKVVGL